MLNRIVHAAKVLPRYVPRASISAMRFVTSIEKQFTEKDNAIKFSVFDGSGFGIAKSILKSDFTSRREPLCYHLSSRNFDFFLDPYLTKAATDGTTLVATVNDVLAGISLNGDFTDKEEDRFMEELKKRDYFGFDLLFEMERDLNRAFRHEMHEKDLWKEGNILRINMFGIDPHFAHQGLGTILTEKVVEMAKDKGYKYVTCAATNHFMKHSAEKAGFECLNTIKYSEWEYPKGTGIYPKAGMSEVTGFDEMCFMVNKLPQKKK